MPGVALIIGEPETSRHALSLAIDAAQENWSRLSLVCIMPEPWWTGSTAGCLPGMAPLSLAHDFEQLACDTVRGFAAQVPDDVPCTTYAGCGRVVQELRSVLQQARAGMVFIPGGGVGGTSLRRLRRTLSLDFDIVVVRAATAEPELPLAV